MGRIYIHLAMRSFIDFLFFQLPVDRHNFPLIAKKIIAALDKTLPAGIGKDLKQKIVCKKKKLKKNQSPACQM